MTYYKHGDNMSFATLFEKMGLLKNPAKELPLKNQTFGEYKVYLIKENAKCEKALKANWLNKGTEEEKQAILNRMTEISKLLEPVYALQASRQGTMFPLA